MILFSLAASSWRALAQHGFDAPMPAASRRSVAFNNVRRQADSDHLFFWGFLRATSPWRRLSRRGGLSWHPVSPKNRRNRKQVTANCLYDFGKTTLASHPTPAYPTPVTAKSVAGRENPSPLRRASAISRRFLFACCSSMADSAGQPKGWPVSLRAGFSPPRLSVTPAVRSKVADSKSLRSPL